MRIVIDPGHGGKDPGSIGPTGLKEKDVNLAIALRLQGELARHGLSLTMTRTTDMEVNPDARSDREELQARCDIANQAKGDYFIGVHCNSYSDAAANGTETWILDTGGKAEELAKRVHGEVIAAQGVPDRGIRTKGFYVLKNTKMPAVLVENLFISNNNDEKLLRNPTFQAKTAQAIAKGVLAYLDIAYKPEPTPKPTPIPDCNSNTEIQKLQKQVEQLTSQIKQVLAENSNLKEKLKQINTISTF